MLVSLLVLASFNEGNYAAASRVFLFALGLEIFVMKKNHNLVLKESSLKYLFLGSFKDVVVLTQKSFVEFSSMVEQQLLLHDCSKWFLLLLVNDGSYI